MRTRRQQYPSSDLPTTVLGLSHRSWTKGQIRAILDHYEWAYDSVDSTKIDLIRELHLLVQERGLDRNDRIRILNAGNYGGSPREPKSGVVIVSHPTSETVSTSLADCVVCYEFLNLQNTPERKITSSCNHEPDICRACLATSISTQMDSKVWDQIDCPTCSQRLNFHDVKAFADSEVFQRLETP